MKRGTALSLLFAGALVTVGLSGCKPKEGKSCRNESRESCTDERNALVCHSGVWVPMECKGPLGCRKVGGEGDCDQTVAADGDVCNLADDVVCANDQKSMLECKGNKWTKTASCLGSNGCMLVGKTVKCDNSVAALGDACSHEEDYACSPDKKLELVCKGGKFGISATCRGPKGCAVVGKQVSCDDTKAMANDSCGKDQSYTCDLEGKSILVCKAGHYVLDEACKGKLNCRVLGTKVGCF
jgi:hypothetical protein